ncbi:fumarylacetoacetate hydrolase family protein [Salirhabdus salicampi]|uniref:fumarylacetoacetate hydrolase family protein n=1 Tax=Salirhabdus salicampi TaxID=476102 RepID=UPI0020C44F14|nr:fumarylacetoacetate hydrolase family protein [Salirhabdus salicampi]MCP8615869.1 fumarylacetoacetate hydrolase family protein [Salirhabdus salicampi]
MKFITFFRNETLHLGVKVGEVILDITSASMASEKLPGTVERLIGGGEKSLQLVKEFLNEEVEEGHHNYTVHRDDINWGPAIPHPPKIICVGMNYRRHADELRAAYPEVPILFNKFHNAITSHRENIEIPAVTERLDYEAELGIVIGKKAKNVSKENALNYVFGYCTVNDLSARDLQMRTPQWLLGKTYDKFCPVGPYLVTKDEVPNPNDLEIKSVVNGEVRQHSNTSDMIFDCKEIISYVSHYMSLEPGDLILTGTPEGVVLGYPEEEQVFLQDGDEVSVEIEKLGRLTNRFIVEKS